MEYQNTSKGEHYNLRWNNYTANLIQVFSEHQHHETLVDVTLTCEGQFIKAHKLILSACSGFFQDIFKMHNSVHHPVIILNGIKFNHLKHILEFIYHGEIKVLDEDLEGVLNLGESFQVKGLSSVKLKQQTPPQNEPRNTMLKSTSIDPAHSTANSKQDTTVLPQKENIRSTSNIMPDNLNDKSSRNLRKTERAGSDGSRIVQSRLSFQKNRDEVEPSRKRMRTPEEKPTIISNNESVNNMPGENSDGEKIPRPANAFMIFANEWRRKLAVEHPDENNKEISVRLGNMWKSVSSETKEAYYLAAREAQRLHEIKYPGYSYNPQDARKRKAARRKTIDSIVPIALVDNQEHEVDDGDSSDDLQIIEINEDPIDISNIPDDRLSY